MLILQNTGEHPVEIVNVEPKMTGDLAFLGAYIAGTDRTANLQQTPEYPSVNR